MRTQTSSSKYWFSQQFTSFFFQKKTFPPKSVKKNMVQKLVPESARRKANLTF